MGQIETAITSSRFVHDALKAMDKDFDIPYSRDRTSFEPKKSNFITIVRMRKRLYRDLPKIANQLPELILLSEDKKRFLVSFDDILAKYQGLDIPTPTLALDSVKYFLPNTRENYYFYPYDADGNVDASRNIYNPESPEFLGIHTIRAEFEETRKLLKDNPNTRRVFWGDGEYPFQPSSFDYQESHWEDNGVENNSLTPREISIILTIAESFITDPSNRSIFEELRRDIIQLESEKAQAITDARMTHGRIIGSRIKNYADALGRILLLGGLIPPSIQISRGFHDAFNPQNNDESQQVFYSSTSSKLLLGRGRPDMAKSRELGVEYWCQYGRTAYASLMNTLPGKLVDSLDRGSN